MEIRKNGTSIRAAEYVRMSTEHQQYSTENQSETNHIYAASHEMEIVRTYADRGRSGLRLEGRPALKRLIADVQSGMADFKTILVYDVSRWGRFQDADESAHYEYICKRAGVVVHYCAEQFQNDGSSFSAIVKTLKRAMAAEYSRELSVKVFAAQCRLIRLGYRQGSSPGFGLRRLLIDQHGNPKQLLARGELKNIHTDRVILVPGPKKEVDIIRWMFHAFAREKKSRIEIADALNRRGITTDLGNPWSKESVHYALKNEKYIGNLVWNRRSAKLHIEHIHNSPDLWIRSDGAFEPIVDIALFNAAQALFRRRVEGRPDEEVFDALRRLYQKHGFLSAKLIRASVRQGMPSMKVYQERFGGLEKACMLTGCELADRRSNDNMLKALQRLRQKRGYLTVGLINQSSRREIPSATAYTRRFGGLLPAYKLIGYAPPKTYRAHSRASQAPQAKTRRRTRY